jgi:hypothetical protein
MDCGRVLRDPPTPARSESEYKRLKAQGADGRSTALEAALRTAETRLELAKRLIQERQDQHKANLEGWREPNGYLVPTEPDPEERQGIRAMLAAGVVELGYALGALEGSPSAAPRRAPAPPPADLEQRLREYDTTCWSDSPIGGEVCSYCGGRRPCGSKKNAHRTDCPVLALREAADALAAGRSQQARIAQERDEAVAKSAIDERGYDDMTETAKHLIERVEAAEAAQARLTTELAAERARKIELGLRLGQILGPEYDGTPLDDVARELVRVKGELAARDADRLRLREQINHIAKISVSFLKWSSTGYVCMVCTNNIADKGHEPECVIGRLDAALSASSPAG